MLLKPLFVVVSQIKKVVRASLMCKFGKTLFVLPKEKGSIDYLPYIKDVDKIGKYEWGRAAHAHLYSMMTSYVTTFTSVCCSLWQLLEVCLASLASLFNSLQL